jgi:osmotically-inducible protein OsmY
VKTQEEKDAIGRIAIDVAGAANVDNQLEVESKP